MALVKIIYGVSFELKVYLAYHSESTLKKGSALALVDFYSNQKKTLIVLILC